MGGLVDVHVQLSRNSDDKADYRSKADRLPRISLDPNPHVVGRSILQALGLVPESSELLARLNVRVISMLKDRFESLVDTWRIGCCPSPSS